MVKSCSAYGCQNRLIKGNSTIRFHSFPTRDIELRNKWIQAVRRVNFEPKSHDMICSEHFLPSDYKENTKIKILKNDAVPSVFPAFPSHLQPPAKKRRVLERIPEVAAEVEISQDDTDPHLILVPPAGGLTPSEIVQKDHSYSFSLSVHEAKEKIDYLQKRLDEKMAKEHKLQKQLLAANKKAEKNSQQFKDLYEQLHNEKLISAESRVNLEGRFSDEQMNIVKDMLGEKGKGMRYSQEMKDFNELTKHNFSIIYIGWGKSTFSTWAISRTAIENVK